MRGSHNRIGGDPATHFRMCGDTFRLHDLNQSGQSRFRVLLEALSFGCARQGEVQAIGHRFEHMENYQRGAELFGDLYP